MKNTVRRFAQEIRTFEAATHAYPELSFAEFETTRRIEQVLAALPGMSRIDLGLPTGTVWRLHGAHVGATIGLRADIDAIAQEEQVDREDRSTREGIMHACGHDVHAAALLGAAMALSASRDKLHGDVIFIFQPAEELLQGARTVIQHGLFEKAPMDMFFGLHNQPALPLGTVGIWEGSLMAGKDDFILEIIGKGGHGGMPETCDDPIVAACGVVGALQTIVSRNINPLDAAVLSVCSFHGGTEENLIVDRVRLTGSLRTMQSTVRERALERLHTISEAGASAYGCHAELSVTRLTGSVNNSREMTALAKQAAAATVGFENLRTPTPSMGCEDFALYGEHVPSFFYFLGSGTSEGQSAPWHKPNFRCTDGTSLIGAELLANSVLAAQGIL